MQINRIRFLGLIGIFAITLVGLWLLLIGAAAISNERIKENMEKSAASYGQKEAFAFCDGKKLSGVADNYADSIWLNIAWYMGKENPIEASLNTKYYDGEEMGENAGLYFAVNDDTIEANVIYTRYWHGTAGIIRVLHMFTDVSGIKIMGLCFALFLAVVLIMLLLREKRIALAAGVVLSLCAIEFWKMGLSMEYQPPFILCFIMSILYLVVEKRGNGPLMDLSVICGAMTAFFDFLTTETMVILVPLILVVTIRSMDGRLEDLKKSVKWLTCCILAWVTAYVGTFLVKWTIATIVTGENYFLTAMASVGERISGSVDEAIPGGVIGQSMYAVASNLSVLFGAEQRIDTAMVIAGTLLLAGVVVSVWYLFPKKKRDMTATALLLALGSMVFVRYLILGNQSYLHSFFTYRAFVSVILALCGILAVNCELPKRKKMHRSGKKK